MSTSTAPCLHRLEHRARHELGRRGARDQHGADHEVGVEHQSLDRFRRRIGGAQRAAENRRQLTQAIDRAIDDRDIGA